ncbi:HPr family phosphocarrier protein [Caproicibacter sp.]|uniref:HPr family phosphocarrier protein n=1 Tax=Caproicibacter sp. TaxID=2814884 RepID=UPI003989A53F
MRRFEYTISVPEGLHARPAGLLARCAQECSCEVLISLRDKTVNAKRLFAVMGLGVRQNDIVTVQVEGDNEAEECEKLKSFCRDTL